MQNIFVRNCSRCNKTKDISSFKPNYKTCSKCLDNKLNYFSKINNRLRNAINARLIIEIYKEFSYEYYLGCCIDEYMIFLESKFEKGMNWNNYATVWEIDHIRPLNPIYEISQEEKIKRFHYTNTQPLFVEENSYKGNYEEEEVC